MTRWQWFLRPGEPVDMTGPATIYTARRGCYAPDYAAPSWATGPTEEQPTLDQAPLLTRDAQVRSDAGRA